MPKVFGYKTYSFTDKDPIVDEIRTIINREKLLIKDLAAASGVSHGTISNWLYGDVRRPQHATLAAVCSAMGYDFHLVRTAQKNIVHLRQRRTS